MCVRCPHGKKVLKYKNYAPRFHPHKIPLPQLRRSAALSHHDPCRVLPGKGSAFTLCHDAPRHRQEAGKCAFYGEGRSRIGKKGDVLFQEVWKCVSSWDPERQKGEGAGISTRCRVR